MEAGAGAEMVAIFQGAVQVETLDARHVVGKQEQEPAGGNGHVSPNLFNVEEGYLPVHMHKGRVQAIELDDRAAGGNDDLLARRRHWLLPHDGIVFHQSPLAVELLVSAGNAFSV